jgi:hypothetical protein
MTAVDAADDGSFFFSNVAPGTYEIRGVVWGLSGPSPSAMWFSRDVFVGSGAVRDLDLVAQAGARITGRVAPDDNLAFTAEELRSFRVLIEPVGGWSLQGIEQPTVEVDNTFSTPGLPPGRYSIFVSPLSVGSVSRIVESNVNVRDVGIELSGKDADVTVVLRRKPVTIQGIVTDASGALRPEAYLVYFPSDRRAWNSATVWRDRPNRFGQFTVAVGPGDYTVAAVEGGLPEDWRSPEFLSKVVPRGLRVVVERANVVSQRVALQRISR